MATLTVWKFATPNGASEMQSRLESLIKQELIKIHDTAIVTWPAGARKPCSGPRSVPGWGRWPGR
jgi:uncharacterized membrane protein